MITDIHAGRSTSTQVLAVAAFLLSLVSVAVGAQQPTDPRAVTILTIALASPEEHLTTSSIRMRRDRDDRDVLVLAPADATPERLASLIAAVSFARRQKGQMKEKEAMIRATPMAGMSRAPMSGMSRAPMSAVQRRHFQALLDRLSRARPRVMKDKGSRKAIDLAYDVRKNGWADKKP